MTVLPESPVREYARRVETLMVDARNDPAAPTMWQHDDPAWLHGRRHGFDEARAIVAEHAFRSGTETTYFEYQVVGDDEGSPTPERSGWLDSFDKARSVRLDWSTAEPPFDALYIERRTVTVTQPVRLDDDGEPTS